MERTNMDTLLRLLADYRSFCDQSQNCAAHSVTRDFELSENDLELVSAAAHVSHPVNKNNENP